MLFVFCFAISFAQVDQIHFDFGKEMNQYQGKSLAAALGLSLLVPGTGEYYLDKAERSPWFWAGECLGWLGTYFAYQYSQNQMDRLYHYALEYAAAENLHKTEAELQILGDYKSRSGFESINANPDDEADYNQSQLRRAEAADAEYDSQLQWDWGPELNAENQRRYDRYGEMLRQYRQGRIALQISVGALALGRILSMVDVFQIYKQGSSSFSMQTTASPGESALSMVIRF